jgi:hypothetical protein
MDGDELHEKLTAVAASNDLRQVKAFMVVLEQPLTIKSLSFYEITDLLKKLTQYIRSLNSSDHRGLGGQGKGTRKDDVLRICRRVAKKLEQKKRELRDSEISSRPDYTPPTAKGKKRKVGGR